MVPVISPDQIASLYEVTVPPKQAIKWLRCRTTPLPELRISPWRIHVFPVDT